MAVNKFKPHVLVLPEDDANVDIANGFVRKLPSGREIQVLPPAGGWLKVRAEFEGTHIGGMRRFPDRHVILLVDFDGDGERLSSMTQAIPEELRERVFVLGAWSEPEGLRSAGLGSLEEIGEKLADDCSDGSRSTWGHELLRHNAKELDRLIQQVRQILFTNAT